MSKRKAEDRDNPLVIEAQGTFEEGATFTANQSGGIYLEVAEEKAVDSYNQSFECGCTMTREQAIRLRDWLNRWFPD